MSGEKVYRLSFETVAQRELQRYCNADPAFYKNVTQTVPNSEIPDEHWYRVERIDTDPWNQYGTLRKWAGEDREFIRNVVLEEADPVNLDWQEVAPR